MTYCGATSNDKDDTMNRMTNIFFRQFLERLSHYSGGIVECPRAETPLEKGTETAAARAESQAVPESGRMVALDAGGKVCRFRRSKLPEIAKMAADDIYDWMRRQKYELSESDYLSLLCRYDAWLSDSRGGSEFPLATS
jgi:hypothetical protein